MIAAGILVLVAGASVLIGVAIGMFALGKARRYWNGTDYDAD
jgi:hypothetical protein